MGEARISLPSASPTLLIFALSTANKFIFASGKCHFIASRGKRGIRKRGGMEKYSSIRECVISLPVSHVCHGFFRLAVRGGERIQGGARDSVISVMENGE